MLSLFRSSAVTLRTITSYTLAIIKARVKVKVEFKVRVVTNHKVRVRVSLFIKYG